MLQVKAQLPAASVLGAEGAGLTAVLQDMGAHWFHAHEDCVTQETNENGPWVSKWASCTSDLIAVPTGPNDQNGRIDLTGPWAEMAFRAETHCGYAVKDIAPAADHFSIAVMFRSVGCDGRTLFSIAGQDNSNFLFANEFEGALRLMDRKGAVELVLDAIDTSHRYGLVVLSYQQGHLRVAQNAGPIHETFGEVPAMTGLAELFIGCRSHRKGLAKTLGNLSISDVIFCPGETLLHPETRLENGSLAAINNFWRWAR